MFRIFALLLIVFVSACKKEAPPESRRMPIMNYSTQQSNAGQFQARPNAPMQPPASIMQSNIQMNSNPPAQANSGTKSWEQEVENPTYEEHNSVFAFSSLFSSTPEKPQLQKRRTAGYIKTYGDDRPVAIAPAPKQKIAPQKIEPPKKSYKPKPKYIAKKEYVKPIKPIKKAKVTKKVKSIPVNSKRTHRVKEIANMEVVETRKTRKHSKFNPKQKKLPTSRYEGRLSNSVYMRHSND